MVIPGDSTNPTFLPCFLGTLTSLFSTIVAMSKRVRPNLETFPEEKEEAAEPEKAPLTTTTSNLVSEKAK